MVTEVCVIVPRAKENTDAKRCRNCGELCAPEPNTMAWHAWRDPTLQTWPLCEPCGRTHGLVD